jgi:LmbE family N-acetylglucosaminyl deacetylase
MKDLKTLWAQKFPQAIREGLIPGSLRLLVMAPHPDDFDAIGVTLRFLVENGNPLHVAVIRTSSGVDDDYLPELTQEDKEDLRVREQQNSAHFFGLPEHRLSFLSLTKGDQDQLLENAENFQKLLEVVEDKLPDVIFLPHGNDSNNGHRVTCALVRQVVARCGRPVALFLNRDAKTISMRNDLYMPFGQEMALWKAELLRFHDTQQQRNLVSRGHGFDERVLGLNARIARELKLDALYAEAFELEFYNVSG